MHPKGYDKEKNAKKKSTKKKLYLQNFLRPNYLHSKMQRPSFVPSSIDLLCIFNPLSFIRSSILDSSYTFAVCSSPKPFRSALLTSGEAAHYASTAQKVDAPEEAEKRQCCCNQKNGSKVTGRTIFFLFGSLVSVQQHQLEVKGIPLDQTSQSSRSSSSQTIRRYSKSTP